MITYRGSGNNHNMNAFTPSERVIVLLGQNKAILREFVILFYRLMKLYYKI